ncbi:MAG: hypothetical protein JW861_04130, partial [Bacteroidales bacterium]|nr:hypothetical protein [Bacteroidales bacterium]
MINMKSLVMMIICATAIAAGSCSNRIAPADGEKNGDVPQAGQGMSAGPPAIIYKTRGDYYDKVPVTLSEDKTSIVSYPAPRDVIKGGLPAYPERLHDGFLLDNRGITEHSAFLGMTYGEYSRLEKSPGMEELMGLIIDKDPFTEMYHCGSRYQYKNLLDDLNRIIDGGNLTSFRKLR